MDLKEINEKLYPHNARFLINSKPYYFNILNILSSPALPNLLKELYNIHIEMDEKVYNSNWSTEVLLNQA